MILYGGLDYWQSSNNDIIRFSSINDVISPLVVSGRFFLVQLSPGSGINLMFKASNYDPSYYVTSRSGDKGLLMSGNFPYPNTEEISDSYLFTGIGNDSYEYSINFLHYDLGSTGNFTIKSTLPDSNFSRILNNNGSNTMVHFSANSFKLDYYIDGGGPKGFVLRYDVGFNPTSPPNTTTSLAIPTTSPPTSTTSLPTSTKNSSGYIIWLFVFGGLLLFFILIAIFGFLWYWRRKQIIAHLAQVHNSAAHSNHVEFAKVHTDKDDMTKSTRDAWEVSSHHLKIFDHMKLGSGAFCVVFKGTLEGQAPICKIQPSVATQCFENCEVAVKKLPEYADDLAKNDFVQEINFMKRIGYHSHLVSILGCITDPQLDPCLIIEYCCNGDLLKYVRNRRLEIIEDFLSSKGCIHRDVAARNVLVDENKVAKISDFGLCRLMDSTIYTTRGGRLPIKWMALESLQEYEYTTKSDVWSFGVLLYELFSLGAVPYALIQPTDMIDYLRSGKRLDKPEHCADNVYSIMQECWKDKPDERPLFSDLKIKLGTLLSYATEEYGYLDTGKPKGGQYYRQVSNGSGSTEKSEGHPKESTTPNDTNLKSVVEAGSGTSYESDREVFV
uniref:Protein kinase domain-containing protein n=1 Tax=Plectus sambesii TaxID=2011161 RepID=A0A914W0I2_9BILA